MTQIAPESPGLSRVDGAIRYHNPNRKTHPFISVVTIVLNDADGVRRTIDSVRAQSNADFEYVIVDGGSRDDTLNVILGRLSCVDVFWSERDRGIYDAMNKAVSLTSGRWVIFLNAGDRFDREDVLARFHPKEESEMAYGHAVWDDRPEQPWLARPAEDLWMGMAFSHQALFCERDVLVALPFRDDLKIVADYEFLVRCFSAGKRFERLDFTVSRLKPGGLSDMSPYRRTLERLPIARRAFPEKPVLSHYLGILLTFLRRDLAAALRRLGRRAS